MPVEDMSGDELEDLREKDVENGRVSEDTAEGPRRPRRR